MSLLDVFAKWGLDKVEDNFFRKSTDQEKIQELWMLYVELIAEYDDQIELNNKISHIINYIINEENLSHWDSSSIKYERDRLKDLGKRFKKGERKIIKKTKRAYKLLKQLYFLIEKHQLLSQWSMPLSFEEYKNRYIFNNKERYLEKYPDEDEETLQIALTFSMTSLLYLIEEDIKMEKKLNKGLSWSEKSTQVYKPYYLECYDKDIDALVIINSFYLHHKIIYLSNRNVLMDLGKIIEGSEE